MASGDTREHQTDGGETTERPRARCLIVGRNVIQASALAEEFAQYLSGVTFVTFGQLTSAEVTHSPTGASRGWSAKLKDGRVLDCRDFKWTFIDPLPTLSDNAVLSRHLFDDELTALIRAMLAVMPGVVINRAPQLGYATSAEEWRIIARGAGLLTYTAPMPGSKGFAPGTLITNAYLVGDHLLNPRRFSASTTAALRRLGSRMPDTFLRVELTISRDDYVFRNIEIAPELHRTDQQLISAIARLAAQTASL